MFKNFDTTPLIFYRGMEVVHERLKGIHETYQKTGFVQNCQILGVSGLGKSTFARGYADMHPPAWIGTVRRSPVLYFKVPPAPTQRTLMLALCEAFGGPTVGTAYDLSERAATYADKCGCEVLLVDESQHILDRGQLKTHAQLGDCWKTFHDNFRGVICFIGAPRLRRLLSANTQWKNRAGEDIVLRPFSYDDFVGDLDAFIASILQGTSMADRLEFFVDLDMLTRIQYATDGIPKHVMNLMMRVGLRCRDGATLDSVLLDNEWNFIPGVSRLEKARRPFRPEFTFERLIGDGEPFAPDGVDGDNHAPY